MAWPAHHESALIPDGPVALEGELDLPPDALGLVIFAHGSGSSRMSPRNVQVAQTLRAGGVGTLLFDLLTPEEDRQTRTRFDIDLLTRRLAAACGWARRSEALAGRRLGLFGASTGAAAALRVAADDAAIAAVVSRGGRPDLAGADALSRVSAPTLLLVGGLDDGVIDLNEAAYGALRCERQLVIVPGATHLFEEPGKLELVAASARDWYRRHLPMAA